MPLIGIKLLIMAHILDLIRLIGCICRPFMRNYKGNRVQKEFGVNKTVYDYMYIIIIDYSIHTCRYLLHD